MSTMHKFTDEFDTHPDSPEHWVPDGFLDESSDDSRSEEIRNEAKNSTLLLPKEDITPPKHVIDEPYRPLKGRFRLLQLWEGRIVDINQFEVTAIISDKTNPNMPDEKITFDINEISPDDLAIAEIGSVFYWSIEYADYPGRGRIRESKIRLRRLPGWTKKEIDRALKAGSELAEFFSKHKPS